MSILMAMKIRTKLWLIVAVAVLALSFSMGTSIYRLNNVLTGEKELKTTTKLVKTAAVKK